MTRPRHPACDWLRAVYPNRLGPAVDALAQPFLDPGAGYESMLWDWDAYFYCLGLERLSGEDPRLGEHARGCVDNFLAFQAEDGSVPYCLTKQSAPDRGRGPEEVRNGCKPLLAQFALLTLRCGGGDEAWLAGILPGLERSVEHWFATQASRFGLLTWRSHRGSGTDNHPAVFQRPPNSVADPFLNSLMVMECRALAEIAERGGGGAEGWRQRADDLAAAIERWLWDPIDGAYYAIDVGRGDPGPVRTPADWAVPLKFRSWVMVLPLVAGLAAPERAARVVREHMLPAEQLRSPYGLRSLARIEPAYRIFAGANPSDWLGPVWVVATWLGWQALRRYGFQPEADALARDHLALLDADVRAHGCLHEYYHPETGEGLTNPGFVNWNTGALAMAAAAPMDRNNVTPPTDSAEDPTRYCQKFNEK
jgi:putative isomerase